MVLKKALNNKAVFSVRNEIEIFNRGNVPYKEMRLNFVFLSQTGKVLETRIHSLAKQSCPVLL